MKRFFTSFLILFSLIVTALAWTHGTSGVTPPPTIPPYTFPSSNPLSNTATGNSAIDGIMYPTRLNVATATPANVVAVSAPQTAAAMTTPCAVIYLYYDSGRMVALNAAQISALSALLVEYTTITGVSFQLMTEAASAGNHALLTAAGSTATVGSFANSPVAVSNYCPPSPFNNGVGAIVLSPYTYGDTTAAPGGWFWWAIRHETSHSLGVTHPYTGSGQIGGAVMPAAYCWQAYTVMSYSVAQPGSCTNPGVTVDVTPGEPQTLMRQDVAVAQATYGTGPSDGDTTHSWNASCAYRKNLVVQFTPGTCVIFMNIVDNGGTDTIDLSNWNCASTIDLTPGSDTNVVCAANLSSISLFNFSISYNTIIENFIGGAANDDIHGNSSNNTIDGGAGTNTFRTIGASGTFVVSGPDGNGYCQFTSVADGTDLLKNIQIIIFSNTTKNLDGLTCNLS